MSAMSVSKSYVVLLGLEGYARTKKRLDGLRKGVRNVFIKEGGKEGGKESRKEGKEGKEGEEGSKECGKEAAIYEGQALSKVRSKDTGILKKERKGKGKGKGKKKEGDDDE